MLLTSGVLGCIGHLRAGNTGSNATVGAVTVCAGLLDGALFDGGVVHSECGHRQYVWLSQDGTQGKLGLSSDSFIYSGNELCSATLASSQEQVFQ